MPVPRPRKNKLKKAEEISKSELTDSSDSEKEPVIVTVTHGDAHYSDKKDKDNISTESVYSLERDREVTITESEHSLQNIDSTERSGEPDSNFVSVTDT